jgi:ABC-type lipoprotein export system ATPase subunit
MNVETSPIEPVEIVPPKTRDVLICTDLHRSFGPAKAVDGFSFRIGSGETYGLLGPNGAGKTTIISMVSGVLEADSGSMLVDGVEMHPGALAAKAAIGYVPQDVALYPDLTGRENLLFFASLYRIGRRQARRRVDEVLDIVSLTDRASDRVQEYSGGMKRRLNIAVAAGPSPGSAWCDRRPARSPTIWWRPSRTPMGSTYASSKPAPRQSRRSRRVHSRRRSSSRGPTTAGSRAARASLCSTCPGPTGARSSSA